MTCEMRQVPFGQLLSEPLRNGLTRPKRVRGEGVSMVNMGELFAHRRIGEIEMERVSLNPRFPERDLLQANDLLFARQSIVAEGAGKVSIFLGAAQAVTFESHLIRARVNRMTADPYWLFYFFESALGRNLVRSIVTQVAAAGIRGSDLAALPIPCPSVAHQHRVASVLRCLDEKIDSNRRLAAMLEDTTATIFKARFVDFVGVEEFEESVRVPRGWSVKPLAELFEQRRESGTADLPYIGLDDMPRGSTVLEVWKTNAAPSGQSSRFQRDDILFGKLRPYFKKVGVAPIDGRCSTEIVVLRPRSPVRPIDRQSNLLPVLRPLRGCIHWDANATG